MKIVVIGGNASGLSCACRLKRMTDVSVVVFERLSYTSYANCGLPYHISETIANEQDLHVTDVSLLEERFGLDVRTGTNVISIDRVAKKVSVFNEERGNYDEEYDYLMLSPGSSPIIPKAVHGYSNVVQLRHVGDASKARSLSLNSRHPVVVGSGYIGLEVLEQLVEARDEYGNIETVSLATRSPYMLRSTVDPEVGHYIHEECIAHGVDRIVYNTVIDSCDSEDGKITCIHLSNGESLLCDVLFVGTGVCPSIELAKAAGLRIEHGAVWCNDEMQTSDPYVFTAGDCCLYPTLFGMCPVSLASPANKAGRIAACNIYAALNPGAQVRRMPMVNGTSAVKVFDLVVAATGYPMQKLRKTELTDVACVRVNGNSHAGYYPGAESIGLKLVFNEKTGEIYGAQCTGKYKAGVSPEKRIDLISAVMSMKGTTYDLEETDLAYCPAVNSARDPAQQAAMAANNHIEGFSALLDVDFDFSKFSDKKCLFIDVRTPEEVDFMPLPLKSSIPLLCIPIDELRNRISEIPSDTDVIFTTCYSAKRSHVASRILRNRTSATVYNVTGGFLFITHFTEQMKLGAADAYVYASEGENSSIFEF
ncbi:hypothetical protein PCE1_001497 [Barthelona sp. PCE]